MDKCQATDNMAPLVLLLWLLVLFLLLLLVLSVAVVRSEAACDFLLSRRLRLKRHQNRKWQFNLSALIEFYFLPTSPFWCGDWFALCSCQRLHLHQLRLSRVCTPVPDRPHPSSSRSSSLGQTLITDAGQHYAGSSLAHKKKCAATENCVSSAVIVTLRPSSSPSPHFPQWFFLIFFGSVYRYDTAHFLIAFHYLQQITIELQSVGL